MCIFVFCKDEMYFSPPDSRLDILLHGHSCIRPSVCLRVCVQGESVCDGGGRRGGVELLIAALQ